MRAEHLRDPLVAGPVLERLPEALEAIGRIAELGALRRQYEGIEERRGSEVGDAEPVAGEEFVPIQLRLQAVATTSRLACSARSSFLTP
jgi:hypothetical protein